MTRIVLQEGPNGLEGFKVTGHSGYGEAGTDIVCAAVSILTTTCVNALEAVAGIEPVVELHDGYLRCLLPAGVGGKENEKAQIIFQAVLQGLKDIEKTNPKKIRIQQVEWRQTDAYDESSALRA